jgi:FKBP12-rapamycin complex-associated protein
MANMQSQDLKILAMDTLCALLYQMKSDFIVFVPMINKVLLKNRIVHSTYDILVGKLLKNEPLPIEIADRESRGESVAVETIVKKLPVNQQHLKKAWECGQISTKEDWTEWIRRISLELLKESPSPALRATAGLAGVHYPLTRELFNAGFVSCWGELYDQFQDELVSALETALTSPSTPPDIQQTLLNLAEFMVWVWLLMDRNMMIDRCRLI